MDLNMQPETLPHKANRIDLDPRQRDRWGLPLPRVTFDFHQNEHRLQKFMAGVGEKIMRATSANKIWTEGKGRPNRWAGGTRMGASPRNSVVNQYCQTHDPKQALAQCNGTKPCPDSTYSIRARS